MYYRFTFFRDAMKFIAENENAKLMSWHGPYMVIIPVNVSRKRG